MITGNTRFVTPAQIQHEADRLMQKLKSSHGPTDATIDSSNPAAVAAELRRRGVSVDRVGGDTVRLSLEARRMFTG